MKALLLTLVIVLTCNSIQSGKSSPGAAPVAVHAETLVVVPVPRPHGTAIEGSLSFADLALTEKVRETLLADERLSSDARHIDVLTYRGRVSLRGRVVSEDEREEVHAIVKGIAGAANCDDRLRQRTR